MNLVARVKGILLNPRREWETIDTEPASIAGLYTGYIIPLAGAAALASYLGMVILGRSFMGVSTKWTFMGGIGPLISGFILSLVTVYITALIIDMLAPTFDAQKSQVQALKLVAFSMTPAWVGGLFAIFPPLAWLGLIGALYALYLLYIGLPTLMKAPKEKAMGYVITTILAGILVSLVLGYALRTIAPGAMGY
jgi:Yip1 domain